MKTKFTINSIIKASLCMMSGIAILGVSNIFAASNQQTPDNPNHNGSIRNTSCIEYVTQSGLTGTTCSNVTITYEPATNEHSYFIQKRQKTGNMSNYTTGEVVVQSGEYIQYKIDFGSITGECRNGTIKDILPSCVKYISSEIHDVSGNPTFSTGNGYLQYSNFRLNNGTQGYILVTGQIIASTRNCENITRYVNTGAFKCGNPSTDWMYSSVVAIRTGGGSGGGSGSNVVFTKTGNKYEMIPGETGLVFTLKVKNEGPNPISNIIIDDIWPDNGRCIIFDSWTGQNLKRLGEYKRQYIGRDGILRAKNSITLKINASIANDPTCTGSYINTGKLTYEEGGKTYTLYDNYPFIVVDAGAGYNVSIEKTVNHQIVKHGQNIIYTIKYTNIGTKPLIDYTITDIRPNDKIEFISSNPTPLTNDGNTITRHFDGPLRPGKSGIIKINATVR